MCLVLFLLGGAVPALAVPSLDLSSGAAGRGQSVVIDAVLAAGGGMVAATQNDIFFPLDSLDVHAADCTLDPRLTTPAINKQLTASVTADTPFGAPPGTRRLRVGVFADGNANVIPDGPLFHCTFTVLAAAPGGTKTLSNAPAASNPQSKPLAVSGAAGAITVLDPASDLDRATLMPPGTAQIEARLAAHGASVLQTRNDIFFPIGQIDVGAADCSIDARLTAGGVDKHLGVEVSADTPAGAPANTRRLRVVVSGANPNPIGDGPLFRCLFHAAAGATPGAKTLLNHAFATTATSGEAAVAGADGIVTVVLQPSLLTLGSGEGLPGTAVPIAASFAAQGNQVASLSSDIDFPSADLSLGAADCVLDERFAAPGAEKQLSVTVSSETAPGAAAGTHRLHAAISGGSDPIGDGGLFVCSFAVQPGAAPGTRPLMHGAAATSPEETTIPLIAAAGAVTVLEPPTRTATVTTTRTRTPTETRTATATRTETGTKTPTATRTASQTSTITATITLTRTPTETSTVTPSITTTRTRVPTSTRTMRPTSTETPTETPTATEKPTRTRTPTVSPTETASATGTATELPASTDTPSETPTETPTQTPTAAPSETSTAAPPTPTSTSTPAPPTATPARCAADCDADGVLTDQDVRIVIGVFTRCPPCESGGVTSSCPLAGDCLAADGDGDGCLTAVELTHMLVRVADPTASCR